VAVADVYDAMTHDRVYHPAIPEAQTLELMREERGKHFDPAVFDAFLEVISQFRKIRKEIDDAVVNQGAFDTGPASVQRPFAIETVARKAGHAVNN
jgi:putative two-component system response regulator